MLGLWLRLTNIMFKPSLTRRWSSLKPSVMVGDKQQDKTTKQNNSVKLEIYYGVETMYFVVFVVKSALKVIPSIIIFTR